MSLEELEPGNVPKGRRKSLNKRTETHPEGCFSLCFHDSSHGDRTGSCRGGTWGAAEMGENVHLSLCLSLSVASLFSVSG